MTIWIYMVQNMDKSTCPDNWFLGGVEYWRERMSCHQRTIEVTGFKTIQLGRRMTCECLCRCSAVQGKFTWFVMGIPKNV